jgi:hypothetical protein
MSFAGKIKFEVIAMHNHLLTVALAVQAWHRSPPLEFFPKVENDHPDPRHDLE